VLPDKTVYPIKNEQHVATANDNSFKWNTFNLNYKINYLTQVIYRLCSKNTIPMKQIYPGFSSYITQNW